MQQERWRLTTNQKPSSVTTKFSHIDFSSSPLNIHATPHFLFLKQQIGYAYNRDDLVISGQNNLSKGK